MNSYSHYWERFFKRVAFFMSVFSTLYYNVHPLLAVLPPFIYYLYLQLSESNYGISFIENSIDYRTDLKKWREIHNHIFLFQMIILMTFIVKLLYHDMITLLIIRVTIILITSFIIVWNDVALAQIFVRVRYFPWDFVLLAGWVSSFLILTLTDLYGYTILVWNIILELVLYPLYWIFEEDVC